MSADSMHVCMLACSGAGDITKRLVDTYCQAVGALTQVCRGGGPAREHSRPQLCVLCAAAATTCSYCCMKYCAMPQAPDSRMQACS